MYVYCLPPVRPVLFFSCVVFCQKKTFYYELALIRTTTANQNRTNEILKMFGRTSAAAARSMGAVGSRKMSSLPTFLYNNVWRKSTAMYITYIGVGCIVLGSTYEAFTESIWRSVNKGVSSSELCFVNFPPFSSFSFCKFFVSLQKLYDQIDWSKFKSDEDE